MKDKLSLEDLWTTITSAFQIARKHWRRGQYGLGVSDSQNAEWENQIQRIHQAESQIKARLQPVPEEKKSENELLRKLLWVRHGCPFHCLYGDDGEMQCSCCGIDFKRASAEYIERRFIEINEPKMAQALRFFENQGKKESSDEKNGKKKVI